MSVCLSVHMSVCLSVCISVYLSVSVCLLVCPYVCLSVCLFVCPSVCLCLFLCLSVSVSLSVCLSVYLSHSSVCCSDSLSVALTNHFYCRTQRLLRSIILRQSCCSHNTMGRSSETPVNTSNLLSKSSAFIVFTHREEGKAADQVLPPGWEIRYNQDGKMYFVDHNTKSTTYNGNCISCVQLWLCCMADCVCCCLDPRKLV